MGAGVWLGLEVLRELPAGSEGSGCAGRAVPALGCRRLPRWHNDGSSVREKHKCFYLPDAAPFKEEKRGLAGCPGSIALPSSRKEQPEPALPLAAPAEGSGERLLSRSWRGAASLN